MTNKEILKTLKNGELPKGGLRGLWVIIKWVATYLITHQDQLEKLAKDFEDLKAELAKAKK